MQYNPLGKTGLNVSRLSFGASAIGSVFHEVSEADAIRAVHAALDAGINYLDVAPSYGGNLSETRLGMALKGVSRDKYFLSTKIGKYTNPESYGDDTLDYSEARTRSSVEESMQRLGVDYLDIIHIHDVEYQDRVKLEEGFTTGYDTLQKMKREGTIGHVSMGTYPIDIWQRALRELQLDAILVHNHYCLNDNRLLELLPACQAQGIGIINGAPFSSGLLSGSPIAQWHPAAPADRAVFKKAADFCTEQGTTIAKVAFQYACDNPDVHTTLFSTARAENVTRNLKWSQEGCPEDLVTAVQDILTPVMNKQWDY
jgi:aryl-alcohol dehydrogenase-like predicted oxidoreductase